MIFVFCLESKNGNMNQDTALALLQTSAAESEEESDNLVKQLLDKELLVEAFLEKFLASRKTMHLRKLKAEKMVELIRQSKAKLNSGHLPYTGFYSPPSMPYYPPANTANGGNMPYPIRSMHMPMPGQFGQY